VIGNVELELVHARIFHNSSIVAQASRPATEVAGYVTARSTCTDPGNHPTVVSQGVARGFNRRACPLQARND